MTRLIDAEALKKAFEDCTGECACCIHNTNDFNYCGLIDDAPTVKPQKIVTIPHELIEKLVLCVVDTVENIDWDKAIEAYKERPQGEWVTDDQTYSTWRCNKCLHVQTICSNFCPNCGADMQKGDTE